MASRNEKIRFLESLYKRRFGCAAPGKSDDSQKAENVTQFQTWMGSGQAWNDLLDTATEQERHLDIAHQQLEDAGWLR